MVFTLGIKPLIMSSGRAFEDKYIGKAGEISIREKLSEAKIHLSHGYAFSRSLHHFIFVCVIPSAHRKSLCSLVCMRDSVSLLLFYRLIDVVIS